MLKGAQYIGNHLSKLQVWEVIEMATVETEVNWESIFVILHSFQIRSKLTDESREGFTI